MQGGKPAKYLRKKKQESWGSETTEANKDNERAWHFKGRLEMPKHPTHGLKEQVLQETVSIREP